MQTVQTATVALERCASNAKPKAMTLAVERFLVAKNQVQGNQCRLSLQFQLLPVGNQILCRW